MILPATTRAGRPRYVLGRSSTMGVAVAPTSTGANEPSDPARRKSVLLPGPVSRIAEQILRGGAEVIRGEELDPDEVQRLLPQVEGIYVQAPFVLTSEWIHAAHRLEVIGTAGSGTNRIDVDAASECGIPVVHAAGAAYRSVAEHALGLMLSLSKRIAYYDRYFHTHKEYPPPSTGGYGHQLHGKTVGIVGLGFIGRDVAHKCGIGFGMRVLAYDPYFAVNEARRQGIELLRRIEDMIPECDFLVITCPLNEETRDLVREQHLRSMKPTSYVIVSSRGGIVNEQELVTALQSGWIAGAGVDTWDPEPAPPNHPLYDMDNAVLTRHIGGGTVEDLDLIAQAVATQVLEALRGVRPDHIANAKVWPLGQPRRTTPGGHAAPVPESV
jgi:D-3-phosphoglycerate dehydrogenase / 2-oxoglutarate reductase